MTTFHAELLSEVPRPVGMAPTKSAKRAARVEMWYPWFWGGVAMGLCAWFAPDPKWMYDAIKGALGSAVDASSVLAGFQATGIALLLALINSSPIKRLARTNTYRKLVSYHFQTLVTLLVLAVGATALQGYMAVEKSFHGWDRAVIAVCAGLVTCAVGCVWRISRLMFLVLTDPDIHKPVE